MLFYGNNSWSYTRLGKIQYGSTDELKSFLKAGAGKIILPAVMTAGHAAERSERESLGTGIIDELSPKRQVEGLFHDQNSISN